LRGFALVVVVPPVFQFLHFLLDQGEIILGQQVQVSLESHIPVFGRPASNVVQSVGQQTSVNILRFFQDYFWLNADPVRPTGATFILPD
jgi:hypothetical protein